MTRTISALALSMLLAAGLPLAAQAAHHESGETMQAPVEAVAAAINAEDRADGERERDSWRRPDLTLAFSGIGPGDRVLDIGAGGGYYTMLVSGLVGPEGHVTGQSPQVWMDRYGANWPEQHAAKTESRGNMDFVIAEFEDLGLEPESLDAITMMLIYHDVALLPVDRAAMNEAFFAALKPGGVLMISDHNAPGVTTTEAIDAVHRIDADLVREEVEAAGFELVGSMDGLANPDDDYSLNIYNPEVRGQTDRFVYVFRKPE